MYSNNIGTYHRVCLFETNRNIYTVTSKGLLHLLTLGQGQNVTKLGHVAYHLMRLDKGNILKPTPGLYPIPIKSYKQKRTYIDLMTSLFDLK